MGGTSGTGGSGVDGGNTCPKGNGPQGGVSIMCGTETCGSGQACYFTERAILDTVTTCQPATTNFNDAFVCLGVTTPSTVYRYKIGCDDPSDCGGKKCCYNIDPDGKFTRTTMCKDACDTRDQTVCKTATDCASGQGCGGTNSNPGWGFQFATCGAVPPPADAGRDGP